MMGALYKTKKALKESIGKKFRYQETSAFGTEWKANEMLTVVGPSPYERKWYANVWVSEDNTIMRVK
jgi:hypothetical protein